MPLLDGPRSAETVNTSVHHGLSVIDGIDPLAERESFSQDSNRRQKIVVVGLGMVAVAFMYVEITSFQ